jgi:4-hydroxy-3-methylbut-2-en-1-yl diphosphate reductase
MKINIDESSGFCWGVVRTIEIVEELLKKNDGVPVYILGHIIHNPREIERLEKEGLKTISHSELPSLAGKKAVVIIRAHGEPYSTYKLAKKLGIKLIDATCPLVTNLQKRIRKFYEEGYQIVIFGEREHAEVIGLRGVCNDECIVIKSAEEALEKIDFNRKTILFSQTTMNKQDYNKIKEALKSHVIELFDASEAGDRFIAKNTICKYVSVRDDNLRKFAKDNDSILFVAGRNSSNGKSLYNVCKGVNPKTHFIEDVKEIDYSWFNGIENLGLTGATSTPQWYLNLVKEEIENQI